MNLKKALTARLYMENEGAQPMRRCKDCKWLKFFWGHGGPFQFENLSRFNRQVKYRRVCKPWMGIRGNDANRCHNYHRKWWKFWRSK